MSVAQHFLLSAEARTLSLKAIYKGGEDKAYATFRRMRWPETEGAPVCPRCGGLNAYEITTRRKFKCRACHHQFSVTSGTIFASRKLAFVDLCGAVAIFVNAVKGLSALQLSRDLSVQYKTAFVLAHKLREALSAEMKGLGLSGEVEIDGMYTGGTVRPENRKEDRKDRRFKANQSDERRVVIVMRERQGRTLTFVGRARPRVSSLPRRTLRPAPRCMPTKPCIGTACTPSSPTRGVSTIPRPIARTASTPIRPSPTFLACGG